jgi:hypothetical protein
MNFEHADFIKWLIDQHIKHRRWPEVKAEQETYGNENQDCGDERWPRQQPVA